MRRSLALIAALLLAGCGGTTSSGSGGSSSGAEGLPRVEVLELNAKSGRSDLAGLRPADSPLLVWFWAPY